MRAFPAWTNSVKTEDDGTVKSAKSRGALDVSISARAADLELVVCHRRDRRCDPEDEWRYARVVHAIEAAVAAWNEHVDDWLGSRPEQSDALEGRCPSYSGAVTTFATPDPGQRAARRDRRHR